MQQLTAAKLSATNLASDVLFHNFIENSRAYRLRYAFYYAPLHISYSYIPKNACTTLKRTLGVASGQMALDANPHSFEFIEESISLHLTARKLIVIRNPFRRIVSAYIDKIIKPYEGFAVDLCKTVCRIQRGMTETQTEAALKQGLTPSFREFLAFLMSKRNELLNEHIRPQSTFFVFKSYDDIFCVEHLDRQWKSSTYGTIPLLSYFDHSIGRNRIEISGANFLGNNESLFDTPGGLIYKHINRSATVPHYAEFFRDKTLLRNFAIRYYDDIVLYRELFPEMCADDLINITI